ncbi:peptidase inhibitor family I36 protein [Aeromicrobium endophyticum]|uniref:Peptidase inhibitor family I36 protein n=1 Tax=Aeromicrobium endophyticum TaxID=2292704 RepID=A0A371P9U2_9ACTN|nr:peptidase inhibitor family I36 protein [Aeromicrobium endophyticum]REK72695.1 hypothetical protein DX116_03565 [Aeromicrobium endophyticum]
MITLSALSHLLAGTVLVASAAGGPAVSSTDTPLMRARSDCPSGSFCVWSGTSFTGSFKKLSTTNAYLAIDLSSTRSYYNHRSQRTWFHEQSDGSGSKICVDPGVSRASTSGWATSAEAAYLATVTSC